MQKLLNEFALLSHSVLNNRINICKRQWMKKINVTFLVLRKDFLVVLVVILLIITNSCIIFFPNSISPLFSRMEPFFDNLIVRIATLKHSLVSLGKSVWWILMRREISLFPLFYFSFILWNWLTNFVFVCFFWSFLAEGGVKCLPLATEKFCQNKLHLNFFFELFRQNISIFR
jgi:hypothetical protein